MAGGLVATMQNFGRVSGVAVAVLLLDMGLSLHPAADLYYKAISLTFYAGSILAFTTLLFLLIRLKLNRSEGNERELSV